VSCPIKWQPTTGLCAGVALEFLQPVTAARLLIKINIKNQCLAKFVPPEQMLLCCYCRLLQPQATLAQNPLLAVGLLTGQTERNCQTIFISPFYPTKFNWFVALVAIKFCVCLNFHPITFNF